MDSTELSLYRCDSIVREIEAIAEANQGDITEEQLNALVQAQTTSMVKLEGLCGFIAMMEGRVELCKKEEGRVAEMCKRAERRIKSIKQFLVPFVQEQRERYGRPLVVGTFQLSTRKATSVHIEDEQVFLNNTGDRPELHYRKEVITPNKTAIKEQLEQGKAVPSCSLQTNTTLILK